MTKSRRKKQVVKDTLYVICGNTKTEKNYFDHLKKRFNKYLGKMKIKTVKLGDNSCSPDSLIKDAKKEIKSVPKIQSCWIICDKDMFNLNTVTEKAERHNSSEKTKIYIIWSNISFEIWFLYHFEYLTREMSVKELEEKLTQIMNNKMSLKKKYSKSDKGFIEKLMKEENERKAISNSKKSVQTHRNDMKTPNESCSSTVMYKLFEYIKNYTKKREV